MLGTFLLLFLAVLFATASGRLTAQAAFNALLIAFCCLSGLWSLLVFWNTSQ